MDNDDTFVEYDEYEELEAKKRASARRRKIVLWIAIPLASVAAPVIALVLSGRLSSGNPNPSAAPSPVRRSASPTPLPLTPEQRRIRDARVAADLRDYIWNQLPRAQGEERIAENAFASVTDRNYKSDKLSYDTIRGTVVPHFERFVALAAAIRPETDQVRKAHHLMVTAARLKLMAYEQIASGDTDKDHLWRVGVLAELTESARRARQYHSDIIGLARATRTRLPKL